MATKKTPQKGRNKKGQFTFENSFSKKKWSTPEELQKDIEKYLKRCDDYKKVEIVMGREKVIPAPRPYTLEGLAVHLGITTDTLKNYEKREGYEPYFGVIKQYREHVKQSLIERALTGESHATFTIFLTKNHFGYKDNQTHEHTGERIVIERPSKK